jgi:hypothetical protein
VDGTPWTVDERVRPTFRISPTERTKAEVVVEAALHQGRWSDDEVGAVLMDSELGPLLEEADCGYASPARYNEISDYLSVERLHLDFNLPALDLTLGRQAVSWGSGLNFHPTDVYAEFLITEPWRERKGVNAARATIPVGQHQVDVIAAVDDDLSPLWREEVAAPDASGAVKATFRALETDWSAVGYARTDEDWFAGADLRGNLEVGWWVEGGWHGEDEGVEVVAGVDYSFDVLQMLYVAAEYRYDGTGVEPEDYDLTQRSGAALPLDCAFLPDVAPGDRSTLGIHYADAAVRLSITEDLGVTAGGLVNLLDGTGLAVPDVSLNLGSRVAVHVGAQIPFGEDGEFAPADDTLRQSFGGYTIDFSGQVPAATWTAWTRYSF